MENDLGSFPQATAYIRLVAIFIINGENLLLSFDIILLIFYYRFNPVFSIKDCRDDINDYHGKKSEYI